MTGYIVRLTRRKANGERAKPAVVRCRRTRRTCPDCGGSKSKNWTCLRCRGKVTIPLEGVANGD